MRNIWAIFKSDLRSLFSNVMSVIIAVGLVVTPSIFTWYNTIACWNVFENTGNLTVAVANADEGYESDLMPLRVNIGEQVISALRANDQIDWVFTTEEDAVDGAKAGRYYAAVVIPPSFSKDMLTFYTSTTTHAQIVYYANEKKSAIAPKITDSGADSVSYQINEVFAQTLSEVAIGLANAISTYADDADVNGAVAAVASHMQTMADQVDRAASVLSLYSSLADASRSLATSSAQLISTAQTKIDDTAQVADSGKPALTSLAGTLASSLDSLDDALRSSAEGAAGLQERTDALLDATSRGAQECAVQLREEAARIDEHASAYRALANNLTQLRDALGNDAPLMSEALDSVIAKVSAQAASLDAMREALSQAAERIEANDADTQAERAQIAAIAASAQSGIASLEESFESQLKPQLQQLASDAGTLAAKVGVGLETLDAAASSLNGTIGSTGDQLASASEKIDSLAQSLHNAADSMRDTGTSIAEALASGNVEALRSILGANTQTLAKALAAPVGIERTAIFPVENFGSAMAPFYTTLALFIGSLLIMVAIKPTVSDKKRESLLAPSPSQVFLGRFGVIAVISLAQTTLMGLGNMLFLQVQVAHPWLFMLCFWGAGLVFSFLIYSLVSAFANLGKAIAVLLLIVQVTGCNGSYPLQLLPSFIQVISPYLPATHVVSAMRAAMMGIYENDFWLSMGALALFIIPAAIIGLVLRKPLARFMTWYVEQVESSKLVG